MHSQPKSSIFTVSGGSCLSVLYKCPQQNENPPMEGQSGSQTKTYFKSGPGSQGSRDSRPGFPAYVLNQFLSFSLADSEFFLF